MLWPCRLRFMQKLVSLKTFTLPFGETTVNAFALLPDGKTEIKCLAIFAHGYTSHKGQLLNWGQRMAEAGAATVLFDWPGHFMGSFSKSGPWDFFNAHAHELFHSAVSHLRLQTHSNDNLPLIYGGHSLGALMALKALNQVHAEKACAIAVGLGRNRLVGAKHLFESEIYQSTLHLRAQLVDNELAPERFFTWIDEQKEKLLLSGKTIYLLSGKDDFVVGSDGPEWMAQHLERQENIVTLERPEHLPHHEPELAAPYIKKYLKTLGWI